MGWNYARERISSTLYRVYTIKNGDDHYKMKMNEKELEESFKIFQTRVSHLETLIDGLQSVRVSNANCHFNMITDELRKAKDLLL